MQASHSQFHHHWSLLAQEHHRHYPDLGFRRVVINSYSSNMFLEISDGTQASYFQPFLSFCLNMSCDKENAKLVLDFSSICQFWLSASFSWLKICWNSGLSRIDASDNFKLSIDHWSGSKHVFFTNFVFGPFINVGCRTWSHFEVSTWSQFSLAWTEFSRVMWRNTWR